MSEATRAVTDTSPQPVRGKPQTIQHAAPLDAFIVAYTDGRGESQVRICFRHRGAGQVIVLNERISGSHLATEATPWFAREFKRVVDGHEEPVQV